MPTTPTTTGTTTAATGLPEGWRLFTLADVVDLIIDYRGKTPKKLGTDWTKNGEYRALSAKSVKTGGLINLDQINRADESLYKKWMKDEVKKYDILLTSEAPMGEVLFWESDEKIILSQRLFAIRSNPKLVEPNYLYQYIKSYFFQSELLKRASGSTVIGIRQSELRKTNVCLPPLPIQKRIADVLSCLDAKIELLREQNTTLEAMAQALFKEWFVEFNFPNANGKPYKASGGTMVQSELGEIPEGWSVGVLGDFGKVICGKTPPKENVNNYANEIPFIKIPDMHNQLFVLFTTDNLSNIGAQTQKNKIIPKGSICVSCIATVGLVSITTKDSCTNQQINSIIPEKQYYCEYLYLKLLSLKRHLNDLGSGGTATLNVNTTSVLSH